MSVNQPSGQVVSIPVKAYVALFTGIVGISWAALFVRWAEVPGLTSAFYRLLIAALVLAPLWLRRRPGGLTRSSALLAALGGLLFGMDVFLWNESILLTSAANATLLANFAPLWVGLGAWLVFRERLQARFWGGMGLALVGVILVMGGDSLRHGQVLLGDFLAVGASLFYGAYLLVVGRVRGKLDALTVMVFSAFAGAALLLVIALVMQVPLGAPSLKSWGALLGLGLVSHAGGVLAISYALGYIPASTTSVSLLLQPVLTALLSVPLLGEGLGADQIAGGLIVLAGIYLVHRSR